MTLYDLLRRPEIDYALLSTLDESRGHLRSDVIAEVETKIKYEGYIDMQLAQIKKFKNMEKRLLPSDIDYSDIKGLRIEAQQKLNKLRPHSLAQAGRISGVSPADISVLMIYLEAHKL